MSEAQNFLHITSCCQCGEALGDVDIADSKVYDFDGSLDYIQLAHASCITSKLPLHEWSNWEFEGDTK